MLAHDGGNALAIRAAAKRSQHLQDGSVSFAQAMLFNALPENQRDPAQRRHLSHERLDDGRFANACLTGHKHHLAVAVLRAGQIGLKLL